MNHQAEIEKLFTLNKDIVAYKSDDELVQTIKDYLANQDKYADIIKNGQKSVFEKYNSKKAAEFMLDKI